MSPEIPRYYTGEWVPSTTFGPAVHWDLGFNLTIPTPNGSAPNTIYAEAHPPLEAYLSRKWLRDEPLVGVTRGCHGSCKGKLIAPALAATACETHLIPVNYSTPGNIDEISNITFLLIAPPLNRQAFMVQPSLVEGVNETINIVTGFTTNSGCVGHLNYTACTLQSAIGEYDISINDDKVTLDAAGHPKILALANNTKADHEGVKKGYFRSTLSAVSSQMLLQWDSFAANYIVDGQYTSVVNNGDIANVYIRDPGGKCLTYADPREDVMVSINKLMVYIGADAAKTKGKDPLYLQTHMDRGWSVNTTTTADVVGEHNIYQTDYRFFAAAAILEIACILLVAPTYWYVHTLVLNPYGFQTSPIPTE